MNSAIVNCLAAYFILGGTAVLRDVDPSVAVGIVAGHDVGNVRNELPC